MFKGKVLPLAKTIKADDPRAHKVKYIVAGRDTKYEMYDDNDVLLSIVYSKEGFDHTTITYKNDIPIKKSSSLEYQTG